MERLGVHLDGKEIYDIVIEDMDRQARGLKG